MAADPGPEELRALWQADGAGALRMSPEELRIRVEKVAARARRRDLGAIAVSVLVSAGCLWSTTVLRDPLARLGAALIIAAAAFMTFQALSSRKGERMSGVGTAEFYKAQLERQRDFHRGRRFWSRALALVPGPALLFAGFAREHPEVAGTIRLEAVAFGLMLIAAVFLNRSLARRYQAQLDELNRLQEEQP